MAAARPAHQDVVAIRDHAGGSFRINHLHEG